MRHTWLMAILVGHVSECGDPCSCLCGDAGPEQGSCKVLVRRTDRGLLLEIKMTGRQRKRKMLGLLAAGCLLFQFGGCQLDAFWNRYQVGFAEQFGAFTASIVIEVLGLEDIGSGICVGPGCPGWNGN